MKKGLVSVLSLLLIFGLLVGCSGTKNNGADGGSEGVEESKEPAKFSIVFSGRGQYIEKLMDINKDPYVLEMEKLSGTDLDIELILEKDFDQKMTLMMSSGDIPDVVRAKGIYAKTLAGGVQAGVFMELDELLAKYGPTLMNKIPQEAWDRVKYKGKIMGIPAWKSIPNSLATYIRKDFLDKAGVTKLPQTVDEYLDMLRAFKKAGVEYPMLAQDKFSLSDQFFAAYDVLPTQYEYIDGQVVPKFFKADAMMQALNVYKTLLDEGLISKEFTTNNGNNLANNVYSNKHGMFMLGASALNAVNAKLLNLNGAGEFIQALAPTGPDGKGGPAVGSPIESVMLINSKVSKEKAEQIIKFFEWMVSEEGERFFTYGIEGKDYTIENGKVNYTLPTDPEELDRQEFHQNYLWWVNEKSYQPREILDPKSKPVIDWMKTELVKEGRSSIEFDPPLEAVLKNPDLAGDSTFIMERILKMIYGKEPISDWPKVIEDWKKRGGDQVIKEATERYKNMDGVFLPIK
jgi:putative aldouronate transport system substrate-binding protein